MLAFSMGLLHSQARDTDLSQVTFYVQWYDVGKAALDGLKGVKKVETGFKGTKEINKVYYDPTLITVETMQDALKKANTYLGTVE